MLSTSAGSDQRSYELAREQFGAVGVDTESALARLATIPVSLHCWQGDDVGGFEHREGGLGGGLAVTGNYPGRARNGDELRMDLDEALRLIPGRHRLNLHAMYAETGGLAVDRNDLGPGHFSRWLDWAAAKGMGLDYNPTCFAHTMAESGFTLSSAEASIRGYWIEHCRASRRIAAGFGRRLGTPSVCNVWIPDGFKDTPYDRMAPRQRLCESLDAVLAEPIERTEMLDAVESKLFGIGSESCVIGSHEFYLGYAVSRRILLCLDAGHFHPTEMISDKISSTLLHVDRLLLHVSRGVRWDSDHVVILSDELRAIAQEIIRHGLEKRIHIGLDFFDASINRIAAWVIGTRAMLKALLEALLEPATLLRAAEQNGDYTARLAILEDMKQLPHGAVWDEFCRRQATPPGMRWLDEVRLYEKRVLSARG